MEREFGQKRIVVVDDDLDERGLLAAIFKQINRLIKVDIVGDGAQLLHYLGRCRDSHLPCLVVLDLHLPYLNGVEILQTMRAENIGSNVPVVVWSAFIDSQMARRCIDAGAVTCFPKPEKPSELKVIARKMLEFCN